MCEIAAIVVDGAVVSLATAPAATVLYDGSDWIVALGDGYALVMRGQAGRTIVSVRREERSDGMGLGLSCLTGADAA